MISNKILEKYKASSKICNLVLREIILKIQKSELLCIKSLHLYGNDRIIEECNKYEKEKIRGIAFPTSISLNNCVGNFLYNENDAFIQDGDVVKIQLGVNLGGCIVNLGETIVYLTGSARYELKSSDNSHQKYIDLLNDLKNDIPNVMIDENINDDVKIMIESKCTEAGCFPVENTISYQHLDGQEYTFDSKYIITNYKDKHDENEINEDNLCFDFETSEIYTIKLVIIPNNFENADETNQEYIKSNDIHICRFNGEFYDLKLKMSREFVSRVKKEYDTNAFNCIEYKKDGKSRVAIKQCYENGILEQYPILYSKNNYNVYHKIFTLIVNKDKSLVL